jgi:hypothetical protein
MSEPESFEEDHAGGYTGPVEIAREGQAIEL